MFHSLIREEDCCDDESTEETAHWALCVECRVVLSTTTSFVVSSSSNGINHGPFHFKTIEYTSGIQTNLLFLLGSQE